MAIDRSLQERVDALLDPLPEGDRRDTQFSPFLDEHRELAAGLARQLQDIATEEGLEPALAFAEEGMGGALPGAVKQAVSQLVTHSPEARGVVTAPTVEAIPLDSADADAAPAPPADSLIPVPNPETLPPGERALDWYREDPLANDHHGHWHKVYPGNGGLVGKTQPRQGELFFYMHQQMLARYATEREIAGLPPLVPFEPIMDASGQESYTAPIAEGYGLPQYRARGAGQQLHDIPQGFGHGKIEVKTMAARHDVLKTMLRDHRVNILGGGTLPLSVSFFGAAIEPSIPRAADDSGSLPFAQSGALHGLGHVLCAEITAAEGGDRFLGPMAYFETAISDPFFYRWHGHLDELYAQFQDGAGHNHYEKFAADVEFAGVAGEPDIALVRSRDIPGSSAPGFDFAAWAPQAFAGNSPATDRLTTRFRPMSVVVISGGDTVHTLVDNAELLTHEPYTVALRLKNLRAEKQDVTVRLFIALETLAEERRRWVELDKFKATLAPGDNVIAQPDARSSVIKRKGVDAPGAEQVGAGLSPWCDCGWPYSLLLPSGASDPAGTRFKLMAAVTSWEQDMANNADTCTSMSFCGSEQFYPDARNMGYPFDRRFPTEGVLATIDAQPSMTVRDVTIACETPRPT